MVDLTQMDSTTTEVDSTMVATTTTEVDSTTVASITEVTTTNPLEAEVAEVEEVVSEAQEADLDLTHIEKAK